jgi:hypothetical protein
VYEFEYLMLSNVKLKSTFSSVMKTTDVITVLLLFVNI